MNYELCTMSQCLPLSKAKLVNKSAVLFMQYSGKVIIFASDKNII